jgi:hypothetical protein
MVNGRRMPYFKGKKVDPADVTADGEKFENIDGLKRILLKDTLRLSRALTTKLITYATGQAPRMTDKAAVDAIVAKIALKNDGLRTLIHEIVQSELFQNK